MQTNDPDWYEIGKAKKIIDEALFVAGEYLSEDEKANLYIELRKVALEHARIEN
ncbi:hypothetical protein [Acinetobacter modestus]|uniref:hypothetical protein n=1 Tax=Acinetobacter modestus TaxID=1776740 RepID=UPI001F4B6C09|nr:hypothetical protein [Acinetobacter modestus]MCH7333457.1 hypothetical protein [Acinetobacter modestus]